MSTPKPGRCPDCWQRDEWCICAYLKPLDHTVDVVVVRHWKETQRSTNSARIASLALRSCEVVEWGRRYCPLDPAPLLRPGSWLVFPPPGHGAEAQQIAPLPPVTVPSPPPKRLILLDGSWSHARRMSHRIEGLSELPRFTLPPRLPGVHRLRRPPHPWAMSTIEAIARALHVLGDRHAAAGLELLYARFVAHALAQKEHSIPSWAADLPDSRSE